MGDEDLAIEVWVQDKQPKQGEVIFGWQSADGKQTSGALTYPESFKGSDKIQLITVNCTADSETWYVNGKKVSRSDRKLRITEGHRMVLGGASALKPSFNGSLVALRLHTDAMTEEEIAHNAAGGVMLGTDLHDWWRMEGDAEWRVDRSKHFKNAISRKGRLADMDERQLKEFEKRLPGMFEMAEKLYHLYSERLALRSSVVSSKREYRGDGVKYTVPNQPSNGSWMGWSGKLGFGWACQSAGHINPHELVHGWQAQSGGAMQGNYWEAHANFPQTYAGVYQTIPGSCVSRVCMFFPAHGRNYYHDRLMFQHLAEETEYGPMFVSKFWYDGGTGNEDDQNYPWLTFPLIDPDPSTDLGYEWTRMVQKCITWDYEIHGDQPADLYKKEGAWDGPVGKMTARHWHNIGGGNVDQLKNDPRFARGPKRTANGVLVLNGKDQFVELQSDVADMSDLTMVAAVTWQGKGDTAVAEFSNNEGDRLFLGTKRGKLVFSISRGDETQTLKGPALKRGVPTEIMVVLSADSGKLFVDDEEVDSNKKMSLNPDDVNATECYLGRGRGGNYFKGAIDAFEIYSVSLKDEIPPTPNPAKLTSAPLFVNPKTAVMQAEVGADPLGGVEYFFAETSGNPGGDDSGWIKEAAYKDTGLEPGKEYAYTVKMRDSSGNVGKPSAPAKAKWTGGDAFKSVDGKTIVVEAENYTRKIAGVGAGRGIEWKLQDKPGCSGKGLMACLPDKGTQVDTGHESQCPRLDYLVDFPAKGKYTVWMRSWGANPNGDSIFFGMDLQSGGNGLFHIGNGKLQWQKHHHDHAFDVKEPGMHTIHVWMREDGSAFDKLVITLDRGMNAPDGDGPAESRKR